MKSVLLVGQLQFDMWSVIQYHAHSKLKATDLAISIGRGSILIGVILFLLCALPKLHYIAFNEVTMSKTNGSNQ
jgi:hypothetical protein